MLANRDCTLFEFSADALLRTQTHVQRVLILQNRRKPNCRTYSGGHRGCTLFDLSVGDLAGINPLFTDDVAAVWDFDRSAEMRDTEGGASKRSVLEQAEKLKRHLAQYD